MKLLYIVSTLKNSGPVNQLFNVIKYSGVEDISIVTLSPEEHDSRLDEFINIGAKVKSLEISRIKGVFYGKKEVSRLIETIKPDIIHTQGIRADGILSSLDKYRDKWVLTAHNYPADDYLMKFGFLKGHFMAFNHFRTLNKCKHTISCSKSIRNQLHSKGINSFAIQNGTESSLEKYISFAPQKAGNKKFITVGSLISRKNVKYLIHVFNDFFERSSGNLIILGDGPERDMLEGLVKNNRITFEGNVSNVRQYLNESTFFVSSSKSEGLPNTVLEAMSEGLPCLLSDIPPHLEIENETKSCVKCFSLSDHSDLLRLLEEPSLYNDLDKKSIESMEVQKNKFSSEVMSKKYVEFYSGILNV